MVTEKPEDQTQAPCKVAVPTLGPPFHVTALCRPVLSGARGGWGWGSGGLCAPFKVLSPLPPLISCHPTLCCLSEPGEFLPCIPSLTTLRSSRNFEVRAVLKGFSDQF